MRGFIRRAITAGLAGAALSGAALLAPASALPLASASSYDAGGAKPIQGWVEFCASRPAECVVDASEPRAVSLDDATWAKIVSINTRVNAAIRPVTDWDAYGVADLWTYPENGYGDCEDYQLLKRSMLAKAGVPRRAMRMTVVIDEKGEGHAVLMLRTDRGDLILDNKTNAVLPWHETGYVYVKREGQEDARWTSLGHARSPIATANRD